MEGTTAQRTRSVRTGKGVLAAPLRAQLSSSRQTPSARTLRPRAHRPHRTALLRLDSSVEGRAEARAGRMAGATARRGRQHAMLGGIECVEAAGGRARRQMRMVETHLADDGNRGVVIRDW